MQISQLCAFVAAVAEGGVSAGARRLGVAQPTLTRSIKQLEAELGATLLARGPSGMVVTEFGRQLLPYAQGILRSHGKIEEAFEQFAGDGAGEVFVATSAVPRTLLFPHALAMLRQRFPKVRLTVAEAVYPAVLHQFCTGKIDFAVCPVPAHTEEGAGKRDHEPAVRVDPLLDVRLTVAMRNGHAQAHATTLEDLRECAWIASGPATGVGLQELFAAHGLGSPDCHVQCESVECALRLVAETDMLTLAPDLLIDRGIAEGRLTHLTHGGLEVWARICLLTPAARALTPAAQYFYAAMREVARSAGSRTVKSVAS